METSRPKNPLFFISTMDPFVPPLQDIRSLWPASGIPPSPSKYREDGTHPDMMLGFQFSPSPQDIARSFLRAKVSVDPVTLPANLIREMDVYRFNPEDLPITMSNDTQRWRYFFVYMTEENKNHTTPAGYWKVVESDVLIRDENTDEVLGLQNSFTYYTRELGPNGRYKTNWTMEEYRLKDEENLKDPKMKNWVVCRIQTTIPKVYATKKASRKRKRRRRVRKEEECRDDMEANTEEKPDSSVAST